MNFARNANLDRLTSRDGFNWIVRVVN